MIQISQPTLFFFSRNSPADRVFISKRTVLYKRSFFINMNQIFVLMLVGCALCILSANNNECQASAIDAGIIIINKPADIDPETVGTPSTITR